MSAPTASAGLMLRRTMSRARRSAFFRADDYEAAHVDLGGVDLLEHYAEHGVWEGRAAITPEHAAARLSQAVLLAEIGAPEVEPLRQGYRQALTARPTVHIPEDATDEELRLAGLVVEALGTIAVRASITRGGPSHAEAASILIQPHRLFSTPARQTPECVVDAVVATTCAPQDDGFSAALPYMLAARGMVTTEASTYALLADARVPTALLAGLYSVETDEAPPHAHPLFHGLTRDIRNAAAFGAWSERPIDIVALEPATSARTAAWSRMALALSKRRTIVYQPPPGALSEQDEGAMRRYLYSRSKLVLHLHGGEPASLDARLIEEVAAAGALLISEPSPPHPIVRSGMHYFEASARRMPALAEDLLSTEAGREAAGAAVRATRRALRRLRDPELAGLAMARLFGADQEAER